MNVIQEQQEQELKKYDVCFDILKNARTELYLGMRFMDVKQQDKKKKKSGSMISAVVFCGLMIMVSVLLIWAFRTDPAGAPPLPIFLVLVAIPLVFAAGAIAALMQRMKEIDGGEEDAASKY